MNPLEELNMLTVNNYSNKSEYIKWGKNIRTAYKRHIKKNAHISFNVFISNRILKNKTATDKTKI